MDKRRNVRTPVLARWLLHGLVPRGQREFALGDLEEQFQGLVDSHLGRRGARAWYWRQVWKCFNQRAVSPQTGYAPPRLKGAGIMETFWQDVRYALRTMRQKPLFTSVVVLTLALGIGANTAIFTVVNAVLLRRLPYADPDRLMYVLETNLKKGWTAFSVSPPNFVDWRAQARSFESLAAIRSGSYNYSGGEQPERLAGRQVTEGFFAMLGVQPQLGRWLEKTDYQMGQDRVVLLTHSAWQRLFAGDPGVLNRVMLLNGESYTVVGVLPPQFRMYQADLWTPHVFNAGELGRRGLHFLTVMGRLRPGVNVEQARQEMGAMAERLAAEYPDTNRDWGVAVTPMHEWIVSDVRTALLMLTGAVALVLLIACANVANLLLARASARAREMGVRTALGASRSRLVRQLLTESLILAGMGGVLGLLLATWGTDALASSLGSVLPRASEVSVDARVVAFTILASVITGLLFGVAPAWMVSRTNLQETLKEGGGSGTAERRGWVRNSLVVTEVALAVMLVVGSGLLIQSLIRLNEVNPGFNTGNALTFRVILPDTKYPDGDRQRAFFDQILERMRALPRVEGAAMTGMIPLGGSDELYGFYVEGRATADGDLPSPLYYLVSHDYFRVMGIPLLAGRAFTEQDTAGAPPVVMINRAFAERIFPGEDPIGHRIRLGRDSTIVREIVGVVGNTKHYWLGENDPLQIYEPFAQMPRTTSMIVLRTSVDPGSLAAAVRREVQSVDAEQPVVGLRTLGHMLDDSVSQPRFRTKLLSLFGGLALLLASLGVYSLMAYSVARRTQEIGIRMALGAQPYDVIRMVVCSGMSLTTLGVAIGLGGAYAATRLITDLLYGVGPSDPVTFALAAVILVGVALVACIVPALRAAHTDPLAALRYQ